MRFPTSFPLNAFREDYYICDNEGRPWHSHPGIGEPANHVRTSIRDVRDGCIVPGLRPTTLHRPADASAGAYVPGRATMGR